MPPTTAVDNFSLAGQSNSFRQANRFFTDCFPLIGKLVDKASLGLTGVIACEKMLVSILTLDVTNVDRKSAELYEQSLSSLYRWHNYYHYTIHFLIPARDFY